MRRLITKPFQFNKNRYLFTVETDNLRWYLKCHEGSSEKNNEVDLSQLKDLKARILKLIRDEHGYSLASELLRPGHRVSPELRKYYKIPYLISHDLKALIDELDTAGFLIRDFEQTDIMDYLTAHDIRFIEFFYKDRHYVFTSYTRLKAFQDILSKEIANKQKEIREMSELDSKLYFSLRQIAPTE